MNPVMMQPAECNSIFRVVSLTDVRIPRDNMMGFDAFSASAEPAGEPVTLPDLIGPCSAAVLLDPVLVKILFMRNRFPALTVVA